MRITSGGDVGIGTSSPLQTTANRRVLNVNGTNQAIINLSCSGTLAGYLYADNTNYSEFYSVGQLALLANGSQPMTFSTNGSERMRITSDAFLLIGKTSAGVDSGDGVRVDQNGNIFTSVVAGEASYYLRDITNATYRFYVTAAGQIYATNTSISGISDQRLKENIKDLDVGLDAIMALRPRKYDWKPESGNSGKNVRGFIAQEVEAIFPDLIDEWKSEGEITYKSLRQDFIPILVKAIQEQQAQIEELKELIKSK
jgi:hypothetical protein